MSAKPLYEITQHVCKVCFGRILSRRDGARTVYRCADCGLEKEGTTPHVVCACGTKFNARNAAIRCEPNDKRTPEFPFEICAKQT